MKFVAGAIAVLLMGVAAPLLAANADRPYQNVDKKDDTGNDTGNSQVDLLNRNQLDRNQGVTAPMLGTAPSTAPVQAPAPPAR